MRALHGLDELVGRFVTFERPEVHWEDPGGNFRFDSVEEAMEALHDPHFGQHLRQGKGGAPVLLKEVEEFPCYSGDIATAWEAVARFDRALHVRHAEGKWLVAFDGTEPIAAASAPVAICCAALRAKGIEIDFTDSLAPIDEPEADDDPFAPGGSRF